MTGFNLVPPPRRMPGSPAGLCGASRGRLRRAPEMRGWGGVVSICHPGICASKCPGPSGGGQYASGSRINPVGFSGMTGIGSSSFRLPGVSGKEGGGKRRAFAVSLFALRLRLGLPRGKRRAFAVSLVSTSPSNHRAWSWRLRRARRRRRCRARRRRNWSRFRCRRRGPRGCRRSRPDRRSRRRR